MVRGANTRVKTQKYICRYLQVGQLRSTKATAVNAVDEG
jgi:hypothetical protein